MDFVFPADHRVKIKEKKKIEKYLEIAREQNWNMKVTVVLIVIGMLSKGLKKRLEESEIWGRIKTIQTTVLLRLARILKTVLETWRDLLSLKLHWKITCQTLWEKTCKEWNNDNNHMFAYI